MTTTRTLAGPYDDLYDSRSGPLWTVPGRLVRRVAEWLPARSVVWDAGCGDGKNALYLIQRGYEVAGVDISSKAIARLRDRFARAGLESVAFAVGDACATHPPDSTIDCLISYGLFHCLEPELRVDLHRELHASVRPGGYILFSALTDALPLSGSHRTPGVVLASDRELRELFDGDYVVEVSSGLIRENHLPLVGEHEHSATWIVAMRSS